MTPPSLLNTQSLQEDTPVVVTLVNNSFLPLYRNWAEALARLQIPNILTVALDSETYQNLQSEYDNVTLLAASKRTDILQLKTRTVAELHDKGFDVIFSDVDAIWRKDCREVLYVDSNRHYDLLFSQAFGLPASVVRLQGFSLCTGFYFVRKESALKQFFKEWIAVQEAHPEYCDQLSLNAFLLDLTPSWTVNPKQILTAQEAFYSEKGKKREEIPYISSPNTIYSTVKTSDSQSIQIGVLPFSAFRRGQSPATDDPYMVHIGSGGDVNEKIKEIKHNEPSLWFIP